MKRILFAALALAGLALSACLFAPLIALGSVAVVYVLTSSAHAAEVATVGNTAVVVPWGDMAVAVANTIAAFLVPVLVGAIIEAIRRVAPWAALFLTQRRIEDSVSALKDFGLNAVAGAAKGKTLSFDIGSKVIAEAVNRGLHVTPEKVMAKAGGPVGMAERVFRSLDLDEGATIANTLAPAIKRIKAGLDGR